MKKMALIFLLGAFHFAQAQERVEEEKPTQFHRISLVMGHAHIPGGIKPDGSKKWQVLGAWGFDYDYWFNPHWAVGLHSDIIVENFEVEQEGKGETEVVLERSYPLASALMLAYKPKEHLTLLLGAGGEFAREESFFLIRAGLEYGWELSGEWEIGLSLMGDFKVEGYNSWTLGVGISKIFGKEPEREK